MPTYRIELAKRAQKDLNALDAETRTRALASIAKLQDDPRPPGCKKLAGGESTYRVRVGSYRIVYAIEGARLVVLVLRIGHRRDVYR